MTIKKRQRNVQVYQCQKCGSPFSWGHTSQEYVGTINVPVPAPTQPPPCPAPPVNTIPAPPLTPMYPIPAPPPLPIKFIALQPATGWLQDQYEFKVEVKCLSCGDKQTSKTKEDGDINDLYDTMVKSKYAKVKSPFIAEFQFLSVKLDKATMKLSNNVNHNKHGLPSFFAFCKDRNGLMYRFGGESALKVIYGAVKGRWFESRVSIQKFWKTNKGKPGHFRKVGPADTIQHFRQSPRIIGEITLL